jgi:hypothetical protein
MDNVALELIKRDCENLILEKAKENKLYVDDPSFDNETKAFLGNKYNMLAKDLFPIWCDEINRLESEKKLICVNNKYILNE